MTALLDLRRNGVELLALVSETGEVRLVEDGRLAPLPFSAGDLTWGELAVARERLDAARAVEARR